MARGQFGGDWLKQSGREPCGIKGTQTQSGRQHYQETAIYVDSSCTIVFCLVPALATSLMAHHSLCLSANHLEELH